MMRGLGVVCNVLGIKELCCGRWVGFDYLWYVKVLVDRVL